MSGRIKVQDATGILTDYPPHGVIQSVGTANITDGTAGYAPGCIHQDVSNGVVYVNEGTKTSCDFNAVSVP